MYYRKETADVVCHFVVNASYFKARLNGRQLWPGSTMLELNISVGYTGAKELYCPSVGW